MKKPIIGVIAPRIIVEDRPFRSSTSFVNNYPKRIAKAGGIPIGLLFSDGRFNLEEAELCDGFVIQGGADIESTGINIINYAIKNNKPVLGVCLGMQTMAAYEWIVNKLGENPAYEKVDDFYEHKYEDEILNYYSGHNEVDPFYLTSIQKAKHDVLLDKESKLYRIFNNDVISMPSLHKQIVIDDVISNGKYFKVAGRSKDGIIEALESIDPNLWLVGVQFHPELEKENLELFKSLIKEAAKRK